MKNKNKTVWAQRFKSKRSKSFEKIGSSIKVDKRLYNEDIIASIVHVEMLIKQKIIPKKEGVKIIGTSPEAIDTAEDREKFKELVQKLDLKQPSNATASSLNQA